MTNETLRPETGAVAETKAAVQDLVRGFQDFQQKVETRLKVQEDRLAMVDRKAAGRPALGVTEAVSPEQKAVAAYIRSGDDSGLARLGAEHKAMTTAVAGDGGVLVDPQTADRIEKLRRGAGSLRSIAKVVQVHAGSYDALIERSDIDTAWISESGTLAETGNATFERISIPLQELSAMPRASQRLLEDSAFDVEGWLADSIAERFARAENAAFVSGTGVDMPMGFLRHPVAPAERANWGEIGYVTTGVSGGLPNEDPVNALIDVVYALGSKYRPNATFVMNSRTASVLRKLKDVDGRFMWTEAMCAGQPSLLFGYPVLTCEEMPDIAPDSFAIAFGDFSVGYTIVEKPDLRVLRDPYSVKPHVQFFATMRIGGDVTDFSAIRLVKFGTA